MNESNDTDEDDENDEDDDDDDDDNDGDDNVDDDYSSKKKLWPDTDDGTWSLVTDGR